jgi:uncharacterized protein (DUF433 family)
MIAPVMHILIDEDGVPRTINRRIKVKLIVQNHVIAGETLPVIAEHYALDLADVHAAMTYYYDNQAAMDAEFLRDEALIRQVGISSTALKAKIQQRLNPSSD